MRAIVLLLLTASFAAAQEGDANAAEGFSVEYKSRDDAEMAEYLKTACHQKLQQAEAKLAEVLSEFEYSVDLTITGVGDHFLTGTTCRIQAARSVAIELE